MTGVTSGAAAPTPSDADPDLDRIKERWQRRRGARPTVLHLLGCLTMAAGAACMVAGAFRPWLVLYGHGEAAVTPGGGADEAIATVLVGFAALDVSLVTAVLVSALRHRRARFFHLCGCLLAVAGLILVKPRITVDEHQTFLARLDPDGADSHLGDGLYLVVIGLLLCLGTLLVALPEIVRALRE